MKKTAFLFFVALFVWCTGTKNTVYAETTTEVESENMLYYTDLSTGETSLICMDTLESDKKEVERISQGSMAPEPGLRIIGDFERVPASDMGYTHFSSIAVVEVTYTDGWKDYGTGFMVSGRTMLTAAHVMVEGNRTVESIDVYLGCNGAAGEPTARASSFYVCANYDDEIFETENDYAVIRFSTDITDSWFGINAQDNPVNIPYAMYVAGYPRGECIWNPGLGQVKTFEMWHAAGSVVGFNDNILVHTIETTQGESGAPVYYYDNVRQQWMVCGIHVGIKDNQKQARRITGALYDYLDNHGFI